MNVNANKNARAHMPNINASENAKMRVEQAHSKDGKAKLAIDMMIRRIQKYIGSYMALLEKVDAIVPLLLSMVLVVMKIE